MAFLDYLVTEIQKQYGSDLQELCILVPSRRAVVFLREAFAKHYKQTIWAPKMMAIQDFVRNSSEWQFPEPLWLIFELYQSYHRVMSANGAEEAEPFENFYSWGEMLLKDFDEVDRYCVDAKQLFTNVRELREIEQFFALPEENMQAIRRFWESIHKSGEAPTDLQQEFLSVWQLMHEVYTDFRKNLKAKHLAYDGMAYRQLADKLLTGEDLFEYKHLIFAGFNALSKSEERIIEYLLSEEKASIYWDADDFYLEQKGKKKSPLMGLPGKFIQYYHEKWKERASYLLLHQMEKTPKEIHITAVPLQTGMAQYVGNLLQDRKIEDHNFRQHAVVLADEQLLFPVLYALPRHIQRLNVTMGFPLRHTSIYALLMSLTRLLRTMRMDSGISFAHKEALEILNNPYLKSLAPSLSESVQQEIRKKNLVFIPQSFLISKKLPPLLSLIFQPPPDVPRLVNYISSIFEELLVDAQTKASQLEAEYIFTFYTRFNQLRDILKRYNPLLSLVGFSRLFREVIRSVKIPFEGEPLVGLQVMGFLETRVLDFEHVFILGANEGILPEAGANLSFVPFNLRKGFGLPTHEERDLIYAYHFYRLVQRTKELHLIYNSSSKDGGEASRFVHQIRHYFIQHPHIKVYEERVDVPAPYVKSEPILIAHEPSVHQIMMDKYLAEKSGGSYFSATAMTTYQFCRLRFYFRYIANLREPEQVEVKMEANTFGSILHYTMEELYGDYRTKSISPGIIEHLKKMLPGALKKAFEVENLGLEGNLQGKNFLLHRVIEQLCGRILDHDAQSEPFQVIHLEEEKAFARSIEVDGHTFRINGTFDRVDYLPEQDLVRIVDYKTGRAKLGTKPIPIADCFSDKGLKEAFQGYLYAWLYKKRYPESNVQVGFYTVRNLSAGINFLNQGEIISDDLLIEFESQLKILIRDIITEDYSQTDDEKKCRICPYKEICNRGR